MQCAPRNDKGKYRLSAAPPARSLHAQFTFRDVHHTACVSISTTQELLLLWDQRNIWENPNEQLGSLLKNTTSKAKYWTKQY